MAPPAASGSASSSDPRLALALAIVKARSKQAASLKHWKDKAKTRKKEIELLQKELQQAQSDTTISGLLPLHGVCKCSFFENNGRTFESTVKDVHEDDFDQLIFRQFLRDVNRWECSRNHRKSIFMGATSASDKENHLSIVSKFLIEIAGKLNPDVEYIASYAHQAFEFFQDTLLHILRDHRDQKTAAERIIENLTSQLLEKLLSFACDHKLKNANTDNRAWILKLLTTLGTIPFVGQRILIMTSEQTALASTHICVLDPFQKNVSQVHDNMVFMFQLIENLVMYHSSCWRNNDTFDEMLLEEWIRGCVKLKTCCTMLSKHNSLFLAYVERITSHMVKQIHRLSN